MKLVSAVIIAVALLAPAHAQDPSDSANTSGGSESISGGELLTKAADQLGNLATFQAKLRHRVHQFDHSLAGAGIYLQKSSPRGLLFRLEWKLPVGKEIASILQVCDGRFLWVHRDVPDEKTLTRLDLQRVRDAEQRCRELGFIPSTSPSISVGGLPRLLQSLTSTMDFEAPMAARIGDTPVWFLAGTWKRSQLLKILPDRDLESMDLSHLPRHLPTDVQVVLSQADLLPIRIEYLRRAAEFSDEGTAGVSPGRSLALIEVLEPVRGVPLEANLFVYQPGTQEILERTDEFLIQAGIAEGDH